MPTLSLRTLNRATLERQWLTERRTATALEAIEHLVGMQAQLPLAPYTGLWTRLVDFNPSELVNLLESRKAVRASAMRATLHLLSSRDFLAIRPLIQPRLEREVYSNTTYGQHRLEGVDMQAVLAAGIDRLSQSPATAAQLREHLAPLFPNHDAPSLAHAVRCLLPTIQVPPRGIWGKSGHPYLTTAHLWLGSNSRWGANPASPAPQALDSLVLRYLAAYGPATVADAQSWSGLTHLPEVFDRLDLRTYTSPTGRTLYDLPHLSLPDPDLPTPTRFLPEFDNLLLSHADRTRWLPTPDTPVQQLHKSLNSGTLLHNGTLTATWKHTTTKTRSTLTITPITPFPHPLITEEAHSLQTFLNPTATTYDLVIND